MERKIKDFLPTECINTLRAGVAIAAMTGNALEMLDVFLDSETTAEPEGLKPVGDGNQKDCGFCKGMLYTTNDPDFIQVGRSFKYCSHCGTKIDWEQEGE